MRSIVLSLGMLAAVSVATPAAAIDYPWCADLGKDLGATNCGFVSLDQCRSYVSGIGGSCMQNPSYRTPYPARSATRKPPR